MIVKNPKYELTAVRPDQYPHSELPEIAFVGRSNVGKSSLINSLLNRKNLARVASSPGKTREINFYNIDEMIYFVDLPGYGYANVSKAQKESWGKMIETYLTKRHQLQLIILLVDIRHAPSKEDVQMYEWLVFNKVPHIVATTKLDKISRTQIKPNIDVIRNRLGIDDTIKVLPFSSESKQGRDEIWIEIDSILKNN